MNWQPIDSAPKDGSRILLATVEDGDESFGHVAEGYWQEGWGDAPDDMGCDDGFVDCHFNLFTPGRSFGANDYQSAGLQPTHWMALPPPPTVK